MYGLAELAFFILYFLVQAVKLVAILLAVQIIVYRLTHFSIYKFLIKTADKLIREDF